MPINKAWSKDWIAYGYKDPIMASAWVTPPPPRHLIRLYHLTSEKHALDDLRKSRLKVSTFSDSNDPFELLALWIGDKITREAVRAHKRQLESAMGLLCFSANWSSPPLWSHYADKHRGLCLGFDVPREHVLAVSYSKSRLQNQAKKILQSSDIDDPLRDLLVCTKFSDWSYEREYRMKINLKDAVREKSLFFWPFGNELKLIEVILGPLSRNADLPTVRSLVDANYSGVKTYKARLAFQSYGVVPNEKTVP
jgi:hypothetical protein